MQKARLVVLGNGMAGAPAGRGEGRVFATLASCPDQGGPLADGLVDAGSDGCPHHDRGLAFVTGGALAMTTKSRSAPLIMARMGRLC